MQLHDTLHLQHTLISTLMFALTIPIGELKYLAWKTLLQQQVVNTQLK